MKPQDLLNESSTPNSRKKLHRYVRSSSILEDMGNGYYMFLWTPENKRELIANGANGKNIKNIDMNGGATGLGVLNANTTEMGLFGIDPGYNVGGISSMGDFTDQIQDEFFDESPFLFDTVIDTLENLASIFKRAEKDQTPNSAAKIKDELVNWEDGLLDYLYDQIDDEDDLQDVKRMLENKIIESKNKLHSVKRAEKNARDAAEKIKSSGGSFDQYRAAAKVFKDYALELYNIQNTIVELPKFLSQKSKLFDEGGSGDDTIEEMDAWKDEFNNDYPALHVEDARDFDPNRED